MNAIGKYKQVWWLREDIKLNNISGVLSKH